MANKRIKDLTQTATTLASDDYVAIDGSSNGTRKIVKGDLVNDISSQVAGTYLDEANNLSDVASKDTSKLNLEVPDVGTAPNEVPLNGMLGSMAYQSSESVSMAKAEIESTTGTATTQALTVTDGSSTKFVVQEDGRVGIGEASPGSYSASADDLVVGNSSSATNSGVTVATVGGGVGSLYFADSTSGDDRFRGYVVYNHGSNSLLFGANASDRWVINSSGNLAAAGAYGIDFGSGASTTLDAYEEGSYSATLTPATSGSITLDGSVNAISYTIIGRVAHIQGKIDVTAVSSPVGNYVKLNLPAAIDVPDIDEDSGKTVGSVSIIGAAGAMNEYVLLAVEGEAFLRIYKATGTAPVSTAADFSGDEQVYINATYIVS